MSWKIASKTFGPGMAAGSDTIPLESRATRRIAIFGRYTETGAPAPSENVRGWLDRVEIYADKKLIFVAFRNELQQVLELLTAYATDSIADPEDLDIADSDSLFSDADATTNQVQRFWFILNFPHDLGMYKDVFLKLTVVGAATEWATAPATAMSSVFCVAQEFGNVPRSLIVSRDERGSNTVHDITVPSDYPTVAVYGIPAASNTLLEFTVPGKDGDELTIKNADEAVLAQALWNMYTGNPPPDDDQDVVFAGGLYSAPTKDAILHVKLSTAGTFVALFLQVAAIHKTAETAPRGDISRGKAPSATLRLAGSKPSAPRLPDTGVRAFVNPFLR